MEIILAFPSTLLAIALVAARGPGIENTMLAIGVISVPIYARLMRASVLSLKEREFVLAARCMGAIGDAHPVPPHPAQRPLAA